MQTLTFTHTDGEVIETIEKSETAINSTGGGTTYYSRNMTYVSPVRVSSTTSHWQELFLRKDDGGEFTASIYRSAFARKGNRLRFFFAHGDRVNGECLGVRNLDTGQVQDFYGTDSRNIDALTRTTLGYKKIRSWLILLCIVFACGGWMSIAAVSYKAPANENSLRELIEGSTPLGRIRVDKKTVTKLLQPVLKGNELNVDMSVSSNLKLLADKLSLDEQGQLCAKFFSGTKYQISENGHCEIAASDAQKNARIFFQCLTVLAMVSIVWFWITGSSKFSVARSVNKTAWNKVFGL